jgi:hypothetical protein
MPKNADPYYTGEQLGLKLQAVLESLPKVPDFAVIEQPFHASGGRNIDGVIYGWGAVFSISTLCANWGIHIGTLAPSTWRGMFFGQALIPQKKGKKKIKGKVVEALVDDWKRAAIQECERLGITLPATKALADDAAEACALAICWKHKEMKFHASRHYQPWMDLVQGNDRVAA